MARKARTIDELKEASNHLYYEYSMLTTVAKGLASGIAGQGPLLNALIESFVIHVRAVIDFLYANNPKSDDVIAEDFFDKLGDWTRDRPEMSQLLTQARRRAAKEVAHLTYARLEVTPETKPWEFVQLEREISAVFGIFLKKVDISKLGPLWFAAGEKQSEGGE